MTPNPKSILQGAAARKQILQGARPLAQVVATTYGPHGRTVLLDRASGLLATKDGVTVAREVELEDPVENLGCKVLKDACIKVNNEVGDGTTTAAVLAGALMEEGSRLAFAGLDVPQLVAGMRAAGHEVERLLSEMKQPATTQEDLERIALTASNGDKDISAKLAEACLAVGKDGTITVEDAHTPGVELVFHDGMVIDRGVASATLLKGGTERVLERPLVAVIGASLRTMADVQDVMECASQWPGSPLLIFALDILGEALDTVVINDTRGVMQCVAVNSPGFHGRKQEMLKDIAALTGADYVNPEVGDNFHQWDAQWFGTLQKATVEGRKATLVAAEGTGGLVTARIAEIRARSESVSDYDTDRDNERIAKLSGGLAVLKVGGWTEAEMKERRARIEDALGAVRAALEGGVLPGAGTAYIRAAVLLGPRSTSDTAYDCGWGAVRKALSQPLTTLADNAGLPGVVLVDEVRAAAGWHGWDALANKVRNLREDPAVLDPCPVVISALAAAVSAVSTLLTVEASIVQSSSSVGS